GGQRRARIERLSVGRDLLYRGRTVEKEQLGNNRKSTEKIQIVADLIQLRIAGIGDRSEGIVEAELYPGRIAAYVDRRHQGREKVGIRFAERIQARIRGVRPI